MPDHSSWTRRRLMKKFRRSAGDALFYGMVGLAVFFIAFPSLWQILTSFKPPEQLYKMPPGWWPSRLYLGSYKAVFITRPFLMNLKNSFIVAGSTTFFSLLVGSFAAYALARLHFRGKRLILSMVLAVSMFPGIAIVSPLFLFMRNIGLLNTYFALILPYTTFTMPQRRIIAGLTAGAVKG